MRGKPVAVAGSSRRAVVLTATYEARPFGVRSAVPLYRALAACPQLIVVPPDHAKYRVVSAEIFEIFTAHGRAVEGLSLDEAFVDFGEVDIAHAQGLAKTIRAAVLEKTQLTISAGVSQAKMVAKIASDLCKPDGLMAIAPGEEAAFLAPLPVGRLWGIGPKTVPRLAARGIETIGDLAKLDDAHLRAIFGTWGEELRELARGRDQRRVDSSRETKSISTEWTFEYDVVDEYELLDLLRVQAAELSEKLEREGLYASTIGVKIKRSDFTVFGRQTHLEQPVRSTERIFEASAHCLRRASLNGMPVRLLGTRCATFTSQEPQQESLF